MATIKQSLKKVYKALSGGTDSNAKTISDIINDISTVASSGEGGEIVSDVFVVTIDDENRTANKTYNEIKTAWDSGKIILFYFPHEWDRSYYLLGEFLFGDGDPDYFRTRNCFMTNTNSDSFILVENMCVLNSNNEITFTTNTYRISATKQTY